MIRHYAIADLDAVNSHDDWQSGGQLRRICPNCGDTKKHDKAHASFTVDPNTGKYQCKRCEARGTLIDFWETIARCPYCAALAEGIQRAEIWKQWKTTGRKLEDRAKTGEAASQVVGLQVTDAGAWNCRCCNASGQLRNYTGQGRARRASYADRRRDQARQKTQAIVSALTVGAPELPDAAESKWLELWLDALLVDIGGGLEYLQDRGIGYETARMAGVRWLHHCWEKPEGQETWTVARGVAFPFQDRRGNLVAMQRRYVDYAPGVGPHKTTGKKQDGVFVTRPDVWGKETDAVAITEAPIDALALSYWFDMPAIACGGTSWPDWLAPALIFKRVVLATDNDEAGEKMAGGLRAALEPYTRRIERIKPEGVKDWGDLARRWIAILDKESSPVPASLRNEVDDYRGRIYPEASGLWDEAQEILFAESAWRNAA